jgi:hypothetical protein
MGAGWMLLFDGKCFWKKTLSVVSKFCSITFHDQKPYHLMYLMLSGTQALNPYLSLVSVLESVQ